jgi:hypothetical protein
VSPVRGFASFRGQRNWPGWWWFSRTAEHVGYESWVERDVLMALDADSGVEAVASQPMSLHWVSEAGKARRHAPDFFVRRAPGPDDDEDGAGTADDQAEQPAEAGNETPPGKVIPLPLFDARKEAEKWW